MRVDFDLELYLIGRIRLLRIDGSEVEIPSAKAQGLLALVGTAPELRMTRSALQDKLWSESPPEQGQANLRQTILRLRRALGELRDCLAQDRGWLGLDPARVRVVLEARPEDWTTEGPPEFAAGLDIADPEFEDWIRDQRLATADRLEEEAERARLGARLRTAEPQAPRQPVLLLADGRAPSPELKGLADMLTADVATMVAQIGNARVLSDAVPRAGALPIGRAIRLGVTIVGASDRAAVQFQLTDAQSGQILFAARRLVHVQRALLRDDGPLENLVSTVVAVTAQQFGSPALANGEEAEAVALGYQALGVLQSYSPAALQRGDRLLAAAYRHDPVPVLLAWRAHAAYCSVIERSAPDLDAAREAAVEFAHRAVAEDPYNPVCAALCSDVSSVLESRSQEALDLARVAMAANPTSPFASSALAFRLTWSGDLKAAHREALRARRLAGGHFNLAWWDSLCALTAIRSGRYDEALGHAEAAHARAPEFKPPLRYLAALRFARRDEAGTVEALRKLKAIEPDFSLQLFGSPEYPVPSLRATPLIAVAKSGLI